ncbi:MAG: LOG family protein [Planctomycetota bacterium]
MFAARANVVTVFGANDPAPGDDAYELARRAGGELARLGYAVANGGYGGTMEASARGAKEAGGHTIGVPCRRWGNRANAFIDEPIVAESFFQRVSMLVELGAGGYVVLPGGTGTLVELAVAWELMAKAASPARPLVCLGGFWQPVVDLVRSQRPEHGQFVTFIDSPDSLGEHFKAVQGV